MRDAIGGAVEAVTPVAQGLRVVKAEVLDVEDGVIPRLEERRHHLAQCGRICAGEDSFSDPGTQGTRAIHADEMQKSAAGIADGAVDHFTESAIIFRANVLEHSDRDEDIELAANISVIVFNEFHAISEAATLCRGSRVGQLLLGNIEGFHADAILFGHVKRE